MTRSELISQIHAKKSFLCVGLDTDLKKIPKHLLDSDDPIFEFNKAVIDATRDYCIAYKPNIAFYECLGTKGWESLKKTVDYIPKNIFTIADAKRGDIGNTSRYYAQTFFETYNFDSVTVAPYMGEDSVTPFLEFENKWVIMLALTSNPGAKNFQLKELKGGGQLFEEVLRQSLKWTGSDRLMFVVGATRGEDIGAVRKVAPGHFLLVPGIGAQGGSLEDVCKFGLTKDCGLLVNVSRDIIYASTEKNFTEAVSERARGFQMKMAEFLS
jgi:orotidine-5'-phosphate decarboxylase